MRRPSIDVVHVGSASRDIAEDDPRGWRLGGGVSYAALTTARLGLRTAAIMGVDAAAAEAPELDELRSAGVNLRLVRLDAGPVFHNVETPTGRRQTAVMVGSPVRRPRIPAAWRDARAWSFVPVAGELGDEWTGAASPGALVVLGWQGLLRRCVAGEVVERLGPTGRALVRRADLVGLSHLDVAPSTPLDALARLVRPGTRVLVTQGAAGGLVVTAGPDGATQVLAYPPARAEREVDATGAGDVFLAALIVAGLRPSAIGPGYRRRGSSVRFAAAAGSLSVEAVGLGGVPDLAAVQLRADRDRLRRLVEPSDAGTVSALRRWS